MVFNDLQDNDNKLLMYYSYFYIGFVLVFKYGINLNVCQFYGLIYYSGKIIGCI